MPARTLTVGKAAEAIAFVAAVLFVSAMSGLLLGYCLKRSYSPKVAMEAHSAMVEQKMDEIISGLNEIKLAVGEKSYGSIDIEGGRRILSRKGVWMYKAQDGVNVVTRYPDGTETVTLAYVMPRQRPLPQDAVFVPDGDGGKEDK